VNQVDLITVSVLVVGLSGVLIAIFGSVMAGIERNRDHKLRNNVEGENR
jgi:hypothetical protein